MKFTPEKVLRYLENYGKAVCLLPVNSNSNKILSILNKIGFYFSIANILSFIPCILVTAYLQSLEYISVTTLLSTTMLHFEVFFNMVIWKAKKSKFQELLEEIHDFFNCIEVKKQKIIQKYAARYKYFYIFQIVFAIIILLIRAIITPLFQIVKLPFSFWYPFPIEPYTFTHFLIFFLQSIDTMHCTSQIVFPLLVSIIFLYISMKLEILALDLQEVKNSNQLIMCIKEHQNCIKIVDNVNHVFGSMIMKTYLFLGLTIIFGSIPLIYETNFVKISRLGLITMSCLLCTYIYNGPADDLYKMSQSIAVTLYDLEWNDEFMKMRRSVLIMMCRAQKPLIISPLDGLMPALTRRVYASFLSYLLSYIMTLRAIVSSL